MGWYYYLEGKLSFPFQARCIASKTTSPLKKGGIVEVRRLAPEEACEHDMLVSIVGMAAARPSPSPNWPPSIPTNLTTKRYATGITGSRKATFSEPLWTTVLPLNWAPARFVVRNRGC